MTLAGQTPGTIVEESLMEVIETQSVPAPRRATHITLVATSPDLPEWQCRAVEQLELLEGVWLSGIHVFAGTLSDDSSVHTLLPSFVRRADERLFGSGEDPTEVRPLRITGCVDPENTHSADEVYLVLGDPDRSALDHTVPWWSFEFGTERSVDPDAAAEHAVLSKATSIEAHLVEHRPDGTRVALATSITGTTQHSVIKTRDRMLWTAGSLPTSAVKRPRSGSVTSRPAGARKHATGPGAVLRFGKQVLTDVASKLVSETDWILGISTTGTLPDIDRASAEALKDYSVVAAPPDRFWADPFPIAHGDTTWLFVEEWLRSKPHAHLSVMKLQHDGSVGPSIPILEQPYHLSYPHVFEWRGEQYMIPETLSNKTVELYKSYDFPHDWRLECVLLDNVSAVDATVIDNQGKWWMFVSIAPEHGVENDQLHLFSADTPLGPWRPHPQNPVVSDVRSARPAGRIFRDATSLVRPSQNCAARYGYAISFNRIHTLTDERYSEQHVSTILPFWTNGIEGTHTFNTVGRVTVVDGARSRFRFRR